MAEATENVPVVSSLTKKVGPLPLWAWTGIPAGAYVIYAYWKRRNSGEDANYPLVVEDPLEGDEGANQDYLNTGLPSVGAGVSIPGYQAAPTGTSNLPATNDDWYTKALNYLVGQGANALDAARALSAFVYGTSTTLPQSGLDLINQAVEEVGAPPTATGFNPTLEKPKTTTPTPTTPKPTTPTPTTPKPTTPKPTTPKPNAPTTGKKPKVPGKVRKLSWVKSQQYNAPVVQWAAGDSGGSPITDYRVAVYIGNNQWREIQESATWFAVINGIKKGTKTTVRVAAVNAVGVGPYSTIVITG